MGFYSRIEIYSHLDEDLESDELLRNNNLNTKNFTSFLNTNFRENSELSTETARMINNEITAQITRKLDEIRSDLTSQLLEALITAVAEKVRPTIQNTLGMHEREFSPWWTDGPVGNTGSLKLESLEK